MAKSKNFKQGVNALFQANPSTPSPMEAQEAEKTPIRGRPKTNTKPITKSSQIGTKENETRATFIVNETKLEQMKAVAHWERITIKEALDEAFDLYLSAKGNDLSSAAESYLAYQNRIKQKSETSN